MPTAAKEKMFSACSDPCVLFPLAASEGVPKNSRLGFATENVAPHQGSAWSNSGKALGIREVVWENCGGSDDSARYYDPSAGRFLREDPLRFTGGINFYIYGKNRPTNMVDPFGLWPTWGGIVKGAKKAYDNGKDAYDKGKEYAEKIGCIVGCINCVNPLCENSKAIGKAQGGGPPVYLPGDQAHQGDPDYVGAPLASEGVRQIRMATAGNTNCKDCIDDCLTKVPAMGMFPAPAP